MYMDLLRFSATSAGHVVVNDETTRRAAPVALIVCSDAFKSSDLEVSGGRRRGRLGPQDRSLIGGAAEATDWPATAGPTVER